MNPVNQQLLAVKETLKKIPRDNIPLLFRLMKHLLIIADYEQFNRMSFLNIARIFSPTIVGVPNSSLPLEAIRQTKESTDVLIFLFKHWRTHIGNCDEISGTLKAHIHYIINH